MSIGGGRGGIECFQIFTIFTCFTWYTIFQGLSLSGADTEANQNELVDAIKKHCPNIAQEIHICNDSIGTYLTVCDKG